MNNKIYVHAIVKDSKDRIIKELKDEKKLILIENKKLAEENIHLSMLNCELEHWLKEHKKKIDKAIEYIKENNKKYFNEPFGIDDIFFTKLLEILGGNDE